MIRLIPRFKPNFEISDFLKIFKRSPRGSVKKFEESLSQYVHGGYCPGISFLYGRMALYAYLKSLLETSGEVVLSAYTCIVVAHAIEESGQKCVFVDTSLESSEVDQDLFLSAISEKTTAVVLTSLFGDEVHEEIILKIKAKNQNIKIILDDCHNVKKFAINQNVDAQFFGFGISKQLTSIFGGMLFVLNDLDRNKVLDFREKKFKKPKFLQSLYFRMYLFLVYFSFNKYIYRITNFLERNNLIDRFTKLFDENIVSLPSDSFSKLPEFCANIGIGQLYNFEKNQNARLEIAKIYDAEIDNYLVKKECWKKNSSYSHYNVYVENRKSFEDYMARSSIQVGHLFDYVIPDLPAYKQSRFVFNGQVKARQIARTIVNLPLNIEPLEAKKICKIINSFR